MDSNALGMSMDELAGIIGSALKSAFPEAGIESEEIRRSIGFPKAEHGDLSSSIALGLPKRVGQSPQGIAEKIAKYAAPSGMIKSIAHANGYINAWLDESKYTEAVLGAVNGYKERYGVSDLGKGMRVIVEYPSVNPNKPWHVGHLRNALLGDSVSNIMAFCSYSVEREDYIDDLGLQMAEILWGSRNIGIEQGKKYDRALGELYVKVNDAIKQGKKPEEEIAALLKLMETHGSAEANEIRSIAEKSVSAQYETAFAYGIYHDVLMWESDIVREKLTDAALVYLKQRGFTSAPDGGKYKGCIVLDLEKVGAAQIAEEAKVLVRSNGALTYIAKDIAFHMWKLGMLSAGMRYKGFLMQPNGAFAYSSAENGKPMDFGAAALSINVIGSGQRYPQGILSSVIESISEGSAKVHHLAYGEVEVKEGTLSGRSGGWMGTSRDYTADDLLREVSAKVEELSKAGRRPVGSKATQAAIRGIALSAIRFEFLRIDPEKRVLFEWDRALDFNANSGPYCMYMYARASRILEKAGISEIYTSGTVASAIKRNEGFELVKHISLFPDIVEKACRELRPSVIAVYLLELSSEFARFYENVPVLASSDELRELRLGIVFALKQTIYNSLHALGISAVGVM